jgi:N-acetylglucosamine-6-phosphate deacetylase
MKKLLTNARLIRLGRNGDFLESIVLENGTISEIRNDLQVEGSAIEGFDEVIDCRGDYLFPGLIDLHCHGAVGHDAMEATPEAFDSILRHHLSRGTTLTVLSTVSAPLEEMLRVLTVAEQFIATPGGSFFAGIHLEGPYFAKTRRGAHLESALRNPSDEETMTLLKHREIIKRITIAPEMPGVSELILAFKKYGITVSAGHSEASDSVAQKGFDLGVTQVTHLYNCMSSQQSHLGRRTTGLAEAALTRRGILCEVIADGVHLPATLLRLAWMAKGWKELVLVSDATAGAGMGEGAHFDLGEIPCQILDDAAWTGSGSERCLAGSTACLIDGVRFMVEGVGIPIEEAIAMASLVPAQALGMECERGSIELGKRADLVRVSPAWQVNGVWSAGLQVV